MKIGVMTINGFDFHPNGRFAREADRAGHKIILINPYDMGCAIAENTPGVFFGNGQDLPRVIMPRQGSPMGEYGFVLLRQFLAMGIPLVNGIDGVTIARNQYITLQHLIGAGIPVLDSFFVTRENRFFEALKQLGTFPVVAKQMDGMGGDGVVKLNDLSDARAYIQSNLNPAKGLLVQAFSDPEGRRDIRALVIGDGVAGAMVLTPAPGQFKANIHQEGKARAFDLPEHMAAMAVKAARACRLEIAGVDIMVDSKGDIRVVEVNYSPGFRGLEQATGFNVAGQILDHAVALSIT